MQEFLVSFRLRNLILARLTFQSNPEVLTTTSLRCQRGFKRSHCVGVNSRRAHQFFLRSFLSQHVPNCKQKANFAADCPESNPPSTSYRSMKKRKRPGQELYTAYISPGALVTGRCRPSPARLQPAYTSRSYLQVVREAIEARLPPQSARGGRKIRVDSEKFLQYNALD